MHARLVWRFLCRSTFIFSLINSGRNNCYWFPLVNWCTIIVTGDMMGKWHFERCSERLQKCFLWCQFMILGESKLQCSFYFAVWTHFSFCLVGLAQEIELIVCSLIFDYTEQIPGRTSLLGCSPRTCGVIALSLWCWTLWYDLHKPMPFQWRQLWKAYISCCCVLFFLSQTGNGLLDPLI